jgi:hypothetical protein
MPQIDKVLFFPQVFSSFLIIFFIFIFLVRFAGLILASIFKLRTKLFFYNCKSNKSTNSITKLHLIKYSYIINLAIKIKLKLFILFI